MGAIYRRELGSFFNSAIGPVFLTVFYLGSGVLFWLFCLNYARTDMSNYFAWMRLVMVLILPLLTMRLLSEERAQKTDQGLLTAPVSLGGIVLGKYFAALTVYAILNVNAIPMITMPVIPPAQSIKTSFTAAYLPGTKYW